MAVSRSAASQPRAWFPPATFQMRLRSLRSIIYVASSVPRKGIHRTGYFYITLHENTKADCIPFWTSDFQEWSADRQEKLTWTDIDLGGGAGCAVSSRLQSSINLGTQYVVVRVWFTPSINNNHTEHENTAIESDPVLETSWGVHFSGLLCLGVNPPAHGRLPPDFLVFYLSGSYFTSPFESAVSKGNTIPRYLHIFDSSDKKQKESCIKSYDTALLLRLHRIQRALIKQEAANSRIKSELADLGILDPSEFDKNNTSNERRSPQLTLRECIFATRRVKTSATRIAESTLKFQLESLQMRCNLLAKEKIDTEERLKEIEQKSKDMREEIEGKNTLLMDNVRTLSREKSNFARWFESFKGDVQAHGKWLNALREQRLYVIRSFNAVFPIGDLENEVATMRSISLPNVDKLREFSSRHEDLSVVVGWVVNLLKMFACVLDTPLRYPVKLMGSHCSIVDHVKVLDENKATVSREFPLYLRSAKTSNSEWDRFVYGIYLLNKNLSQLRWQCGIPTNDLRPLLRNVAELMALGKDSFTTQEIVNALPRITSLTLPPRSTSAHPVLIRSPNKLVGSSGTAKVDQKVPSRDTSKNENKPNSPNIPTIDDELKKELQSQNSPEVSETKRIASNGESCDRNSSSSHSDEDNAKNLVNNGEEIAIAKNTHSSSTSKSSSYDSIDHEEISDPAEIDRSLEEKSTNASAQTVRSSINSNGGNDGILSAVNSNSKGDVPPTLEIGDFSANDHDSQTLKNIHSPGQEEIVDISEFSKEQNLTSFWGDVTSRTNALSSKPSSFQRPRANH